MPKIDIFISGDDSIINLELSDFEANSWLSINNDENNPADTLFLIAPKTDKVLEWRSKLQAKKLGLNLMVLLNNDTHIHDGSFKDFEHVMISNHRIIEQSNSSLLLDDDTSTSYKVKLIIENFRTNRGLIFCSHLALIGGGIAKELLRIHLEDSAPHLKLIGINDQERFTACELQINSDITKLIMDKVLVTKSIHGKYPCRR